MLVVGLSLGGYVGIEHRARFPDQVAGLVAASCCTVPASRLRGVWRLAANRIERLSDNGAAINAALVSRTLPAAGIADIGAGGFALTAMTAILDEVGLMDPSLLSPRRTRPCGSSTGGGTTSGSGSARTWPRRGPEVRGPSSW
ncbi:hypothetical protein NKG05_05270 [Oerskovia sp. M15]